jgi:Asp/Glu/hydantoin racemase
MSKRIALVHALSPAITPIADAFDQFWPEAERVNVLDDSLSRDRAKTEDLTPEMFQRFAALSDYVRGIGADGLLFTCSAFGDAIDAVARTAPFPVLKPNEAMFEDALERGRNIGMLTTFEASIDSMEKEFYAMAKARGLDATIKTVFVPHAMKALHDGDRPRHNELVAAAVSQLDGCDLILLAQFSTASAEAAVAARVRVPVLTSPGAAVRKLKATLKA